jgi:hypothetical protein
MKTLKQVLCRERLRQVPEQFSWVDQALVQSHFIDRCDARALALYLFLVTVADVQGLSYYGAATLAQRLHLSEQELEAARSQLIALELIAYQAPLYQVLALPGTKAPARPAWPKSTEPAVAVAPLRTSNSGPISLGQLLGQLEKRRAGL